VIKYKRLRIIATEHN